MPLRYQHGYFAAGNENPNPLDGIFFGEKMRKDVAYVALRL
jgi:hypothetical protein